MKVTFLVPDLSWPIVGIAARMAKYLAGAHEAEIVGTSLWGAANEMYSEEFAYRAVECPRIYRIPEYFSGVRKLSRAIRGDVVIAMKAFGHTISAALRARKESGCRVAAYLDEWDGAVSASWGAFERMRQWMGDWAHPCNAAYVPWAERRLKEFDALLGTTRFLAEKFGGRVYNIGVDTDYFRPQERAATEGLKKRLGLEGKKLAVFGGVVRPHKGLEAFAGALAKLGRDDVRLLILGPMNEHVRKMMDDPKCGRFMVCPAVDAAEALDIHRRMPQYLGLGDVLAVPLADTPLSRSQMPCKVFEAMAMAKPIVANAVSDLPEVLEGCGLLVRPGDENATAEALGRMFEHPAEAEAMGMRARARCIERYGAEESRRQLLALLEELR